MALVKPFCAVRPNETVVSEVAALPYDVYNRAEACEEVKKHPLSFLAIDRAETQFGPEVDTYADCVYAKANEMLHSQMKEGIYVTEESPCYYLYRLTMNGRAQTGIVGCSSVSDYETGVIKKHENTRADKEIDRIRHVDTCNAQTGPIFLAYRSDATLAAIMQETKKTAPLYDFVSEDGIGHTVWRISDPDKLLQIEAAFQKIPNTYIADGHHRAASAVKVSQKRREKAKEAGQMAEDAQYNYFLSVLFPEDELMIMDYNRVVKDLCGRSSEEFLTALKQAGFTAKKMGTSPYAPSCAGEFGMYLDQTWYQVTIPDFMKSDDPVKSLDVSILQDYLLGPILKIGDPRTDKRIDFIGGIRGLKELERRVSTDMTVAFAMYATSIAQLFSVADAGMLMPPKSTWFEPKLRSGLFIHEI